MHYCYMLRCADHSLYTGYTNDLKKRVATHNKGKGAKYTRSRLPCTLVYAEEYETKQEAMQREYYIKHHMTAKEKEALIASAATDLHSASPDEPS